MMYLDQYFFVLLWLILTLYNSPLSSFIGIQAITSEPIDGSTNTSSSGIIGTNIKKEESVELKYIKEEPLKEHEGSKTVPRKGVSLPSSLSDISASHETQLKSDKFLEKDQISRETVAPKVKSLNSNVNLEKNISTIPNETSKIANTSHSMIPVNKDLDNKSSIFSGTAQPNFTVCQNSSIPLGSTKTDHSTKTGSSTKTDHLSTLSSTFIVLSLIVLISVVFYKLKYKFSTRRNYTRVDYLIDGMYID